MKPSESFSCQLYSAIFNRIRKVFIVIAWGGGGVMKEKIERKMSVTSRIFHS